MSANVTEKNRSTAPPNVLEVAYLLKRGKSYREIAEIVYGSTAKKQKVYRDVSRWSKEYPRVFSSQAKISSTSGLSYE